MTLKDRMDARIAADEAHMDAIADRVWAKFADPDYYGIKPTLWASPISDAEPPIPDNGRITCLCQKCAKCKARVWQRIRRAGKRNAK